MSTDLNSQIAQQPGPVANPCRTSGCLDRATVQLAVARELFQHAFDVAMKIEMPPEWASTSLSRFSRADQATSELLAFMEKACGNHDRSS